MTKIMLCKCESKFQDREYGPHKRVFNYAPGNGKDEKNRYRCTVCGDMRDGGGE